MEKRPWAYQRLFAELKRRRVFNTAAIYGGVAFVIFQAADFVVPALRMSDSVATAIVLVAVCGFPIVVALSWLFNLTPDGVTLITPPEEGELEDIVAQPWWRRWPVGVAALTGTLLFLGGIGWQLKIRNPAEGLVIPVISSPVGSVAVLPFLNLTDEEGASYLSEGIANELSEGLRRVPGLRVVGRTSAFSFRGKGTDLALMGEELNVASLLEGSVGEVEGQIEIRLRLVAATNGDDGWIKQYRVPKEGFLKALDGVVRDLAKEFGVEGSGERDDPLIIPSTENFSAYCDYLRGRHLSQLANPDSLEAAINAYHQALLLDPGFSNAWAALATAYVLLPEYGGPPTMEIIPYAQAALDQALSEGNGLAEGYAASGHLKWAFLWDLPGAEADFHRAIELDPFNPISRYWLAQTLISLQRWDEATEQVQWALELDPRSPAAHWTQGVLLFFSGREGAESAFRRALELAPEMHPAAFVLGMHLAKEGDLEGAADAFDRFAELTGSDPTLFTAYLSALADPTKTPAAVIALQGPTFFGAAQGAAILAHLGEADAALDLLETAAQERSAYLVWTHAMPQFEGLSSDPRFRAILAWVGF